MSRLTVFNRCDLIPTFKVWGKPLHNLRTSSNGNCPYCSKVWHRTYPMYVRLHSRDWRGAASLRYRNRAENTVLIAETQKPSPVNLIPRLFALKNERPPFPFSKGKGLTGHFRVLKTLTFKMRASTRPFLRKLVLLAWEWKIISVSKAEPPLNLVLIQRGTQKWSIYVLLRVAN